MNRLFNCSLLGQTRISDDTLYSVQLGLYVIGYREYKDDDIKKFRPEHRWESTEREKSIDILSESSHD